MKKINRRAFLQTTGYLTAGTVLSSAFNAAATPRKAQQVKLSGHIWVYASKFPPKWDSTPVIEQAFADFQFAGLDGMEVMEVNLRHDDAVTRLRGFSEQYKVPVTGTSYGAAMWDASKQQEILDDAELVISRLHQLGGKTFGVSVGDAGRIKTEAELDTQAHLLNKLIPLCDQHGIVLNLHNHTYEVANGLHDLKGTLSRIPGIKLGPDLNWLIRGGIDPVWFINTYGKQIAYMHLRDQGKDGRWTETVGSGATDFKQIATALREQHFEGRAAVELAFDSPPLHPLKEDWKASADFVRRTFDWA